MRYIGYPLYTGIVLAALGFFAFTPDFSSSPSTRRSVLGPEYRGDAARNAPLTPFVPLLWPTTVYDRNYSYSGGGGGSYGGSGWGK